MDEPLYVVEVDEQRDARLAGQEGCTYTSPPQSAEQAQLLVRVLLGGTATPGDLDGGGWRLPVAGGQRVIPTPGV